MEPLGEGVECEIITRGTDALIQVKLPEDGALSKRDAIILSVHLWAKGNDAHRVEAQLKAKAQPVKIPKKRRLK